MSSLQHQAEAITRYLIDMESAQAVLINGEWGVGKSYFVREILTRSLENNGLNVVFYSLYGVDSLDSIREDIAYMLLQSRIGEFTIKGRKIPSFLVEKIPAIIKISARHLDVNDDISDVNDSFESDLSKTVLVFDDLERASIDINVVLGFINDELSIFKVSDFEWLYKDDNEVEELINKMYDELKEGKYTERYYKDILFIFFQLDHNGFALSAGTHTIDDFIALMVTYISENTVDSHFLDIMEAFGFDKSDEKYSVYIQRLRDAFNKKEEIETASEYESVFSVEDWTEKFYDYCYENRDNFIPKRSFLTDGLINILISKIDNASNRQIVKMCDAICIVYHFGNLNEFFKNDLEPLKRLVDYLKTIKQTKSDKQTRQMVLQLSISRLSIKYDTINR